MQNLLSRRLPALLALGTSILCAPVHAELSDWYAAARLSMADVTIDNISHGGTIGTGALIGNDVDGLIRDTTVDDYTVGLGFAVGHQWGAWHLEGEYIYRYRSDWDIRAATPSIQTITNVFTNVETHTLMVNLIHRAAINENWQWEVGAGVGLVGNRLESDYIEREVPGISAELRETADEDSNDFTYTVLAGMTRKLGNTWTLNLRYRYLDLGELEAGPYPTRAARVSADADAHEVLLSLERRF